MDAEIKSWSCKRCTLENPGDLSICQACGGSKLRSLEHYSSATSSKSGSWTCSKCTLKNPIGAQKCRVCETSRKIPRKIKCAACTYENSGGAKKCEMCNSAMHTTQKAVPPTPPTPAPTPAPTPTPQIETRPGSVTSMGSRHESELMEQLRKVEESAAKDKWRNIVQFCKEVCVSTYLED